MISDCRSNITVGMVRSVCYIKHMKYCMVCYIKHMLSILNIPYKTYKPFYSIKF